MSHVPRFNAELGQMVRTGPVLSYVPDDRGNPTPVLLLPVKTLPAGCVLRSIKIRHSVDGREHDAIFYPEMRVTGLSGLQPWSAESVSGLVLPK